MEESNLIRSEVVNYEYKIATYIAALLSEYPPVEDFHIDFSFHTNLQIFNFNDLVVKVRYKEKPFPYIYLCDLKHRNNAHLQGKENNIKYYKRIIQEIITKKNDIEYLKNVPLPNIYFCLFSNVFISDDVQIEQKELKTFLPLLDVISESHSLLRLKHCYKFTSQYETLCHRNFHFYFNQPNSFEIEEEIEKVYKENFSKRKTKDIIKYVQKYFNNPIPIPLTKSSFETEMLKICLYNSIVRPTISIDINSKQARIWNELTLNHHITIIEDSKDIEFNIFGCFSYKIEDILESNFNWNECIANDGKFNENINIHKVFDYIEVNKWSYVLDSIELLLLELWKFNKLPLVLKSTFNISILEKYKHLQKYFIIIGNAEKVYGEVKHICNLNVFANVSNICNAPLRNLLLREIKISLQGRFPVDLFDVIETNTDCMQKLTCSNILNLIKRRKAYIREDHLHKTERMIYLIIDKLDSGKKVNLDNIGMTTNIIIPCSSSEIINYSERIKAYSKFKNYSVCHLKLENKQLEVIGGDTRQLRAFLIDQDRHSVRDLKNNFIPIIGKKLTNINKQYPPKILCKPVLNQTIFYKAGKKIFYVCGNIRSLNMDIRQRIIMEYDESRILKELKQNEVILLDVSRQPFLKTYWNKFSSKGYQQFYVKALDGLLELLKYENYDDIDKEILYDKVEIKQLYFFKETNGENLVIISGKADNENKSLLYTLPSYCTKNYVLFCNLNDYNNDIQESTTTWFGNPLNLMFEKQESFLFKEFLGAVFNFHKNTGKLVVVMDSFNKVAASKKALSLITNILQCNVKVIISTTPDGAKQLTDRFKILPFQYHSGIFPEDTGFTLSDQSALKSKSHSKNNKSFLKKIFSTKLHDKIKKNDFEESQELWRNNRKTIATSTKQETEIKKWGITLHPKSKSVNSAINLPTSGAAKTAVVKESTSYSTLNTNESEDITDSTCGSDSNSELLSDSNDELNSNSEIYPALNINQSEDFTVSTCDSSSDSDTESELLSDSNDELNSDFEIYYDSSSDNESSIKFEKKSKFLNSIINGEVEKVKSFLRKGININELYGKYTPLHYALFYNQSQIAKHLLLNNANINLRDVHGSTPLHVAAACCTTDMIRLLLNKRASTDAKDYKNYSVLHYASYNQDLYTVLFIFDFVKDVNEKTSEGLTPLHIACQQKNVKMVQELLQRKAYVNSLDAYNRTPLHYCAIKDKKYTHLSEYIKKNIDDERRLKTVIKYLLESNASLCEPDIYGNTALHYGSSIGYERIVSLLVQYEKKLVLLSNKKNETPLHLACKKNRNDVVECLLMIKQELVNSQDCYLKTPLHIASKNGYTKIAHFLLSMKADPLCTDILGNTPLHLAATWGHPDIVKMLLHYEENISKVNKSGESPLHLACKHGYNHIVEMLILDDFDLFRKTDLDNTCLHLASQEGHANVVVRLLQHKANINEINKFSETPLHLAVKNGHNYVVQILILAKANISSKNRLGNAPLHIAIQRGHQDVARILLENGAKINDTNDKLETALHLASKSKYNNLIEILLLAKANVSLRNKSGNTALHVAARNGRIYNVKKLVEYNADVECVNKNDATALDLAVRHNHITVVEYLQMLITGSEA